MMLDSRALPGSTTKKLRVQLLGASSYLCLALFLNEPLQVRAADLPDTPGMFIKAPAAVPFRDRWSIGVEGGYAFSRNSGNTLTVDPNDVFLFPLSPVGLGQSGGTFAATVGRTMGPQWDWQVGYRDTSLETAYSNVSTTLAPIPFITASHQMTNTASSSLRFQEFDAELGYRPQAWQAAGIRFFLGPRVLNAHSHIAYSYDDVQRSTGGTDFTKLGNFEHDIDLWGAGPRAGLQASVPLFVAPAPVSLDMSGSGSAIFTHVTHDNNFAFTNGGIFVTTTGAGSSSIQTSPTVYNLEGSIALSYHVAEPVTVQVGYRAEQWYNLATSVNLATSTGGFQEGRNDVLVHGPFAKITVKLP